MKVSTNENQSLFEKQVIQIAALGVWQIVTGGQMKKKLEEIQDQRWKMKLGLFVTLKKEGRVRGSMGMLESSSTLPETLFEAGQTAATHDSRFPPITAEELKNLSIEVTLLSEPKKMNFVDEMILGKTGLIITRGEKQSVLLPHVALDQGWSAEQFLEAACEKAQLSHKAWRDSNTLVEIFTADHIDGGVLMDKITEYI